MARTATRRRKGARTARAAGRPRRVGRLIALGFVAALLAALFWPAFGPVWPTATMWAERERLGAVERDWTAMEDIAPVMARSVVAAEDADFCLHWGFDVDAIRAAIEAGANRGASTISQQTVKNVYLWQGRSWARKALEAVITPAVEAAWSKRRILEVYLNVAEMGEGVFGVGAAAEAHFGMPASDLTPAQAARLAAILPDPRGRSPTDPSGATARRAARIADGAATIRGTERDACFAD